MALTTEVLNSFYQDSVVLMRVAAQIRGRPGVREVALFMGTPANQAVLEQAGLVTDAASRAGPNDLIITVDADSEDNAAGTIAAAKAALLETRRTQEASAEARPRTIESALRALPMANVVSLSIPGAYVKAEAMSALRRNLHLFVFSDNVALADEIEIKHEAVKRGRLCMGPDQGTAYLGGVGLGFANVVRRGRVGCVAASGTGLQAVVSRLDVLGEGISHAIGVGGRDLSEAVGGLMTLQALDALAADASTQGIVVISKPPHPAVLARIRTRLAEIAKPSVVCCIGAPPDVAGPTLFVETLDQAADAVIARLGGLPWRAAPFSDRELVIREWESLKQHIAGPGRQILGLYTGGTLAYETRHLLATALGTGHPHRVLDLGDDEYTVGRPHPMIDPTLRTEMIRQAGADPAVGVLLLDLVLGQGAHENPAESLAMAVSEAQRIARDDGRQLACLAYILGTAGDPQDLHAQAAQLRASGVHLFASNADAARVAAMRVQPDLQANWLTSKEAA